MIHIYDFHLFRYPPLYLSALIKMFAPKRNLYFRINVTENVINFGRNMKTASFIIKNTSYILSVSNFLMLFLMVIYKIPRRIPYAEVWNCQIFYLKLNSCWYTNKSLLRSNRIIVQKSIFKTPNNFLKILNVLQKKYNTIFCITIKFA